MSTSSSTASSSVASDVSGSSCVIARRSRKNPAFSMCTPSSFGIWSTTITRPMPDLNPVSTGSEMKLATKPSRSTAASHEQCADEDRERRAGHDQRAASPPGAARPSSAAARIAIVVVVLTLSGREVPSSA